MIRVSLSIPFFPFFCFVFYVIINFTKLILLLLLLFIYLLSSRIFFIFSCSGMFRDFRECSGMFRVPGFLDAGREFTFIICRKVMFYLTIFLIAKKGTWRHQSRDQSVINILIRF